MFFFLHFVPFSSIRLCVVVLDLANRLRFSSPYSLFFLSPSSSSSSLLDSGPTEEEYLLINGAAEDILTKLRFAWVYFFFFLSHRRRRCWLLTTSTSALRQPTLTSHHRRREVRELFGIFERSWLSLHENLEHESDGKDFRFASFLSEISRARYGWIYGELEHRDSTFSREFTHWLCWGMERWCVCEMKRILIHEFDISRFHMDFISCSLSRRKKYLEFHLKAEKSTYQVGRRRWEDFYT